MDRERRTETCLRLTVDNRWGIHDNIDQVIKTKTYGLFYNGFSDWEFPA